MEQIVVDVHAEAARRSHVLRGIMSLRSYFGGVPHVLPEMPLVEMELLLAAELTPVEVVEESTRHAPAVVRLAGSVPWILANSGTSQSSVEIR